MYELEKLLYHFQNLLTVKIITENHEIIYKGQVMNWRDGVRNWCKREKCEIYDVTEWDMFLDMLCVVVDLVG